MMALYRQRRRRTRNRSAWVGGPFVAPPVEVSAENGLATFGGGTASLTEAITATGGTATFGGGTATFSETRQSLLPGRRSMRAASGLGSGRGRQAYERRSIRRAWVGTGTAAPVGLSAENGLATFAGGTASLTVTLTVAGGTATFAGGAATIAETLTASGGVATFGGDTATAFELRPSLLPTKPRMRAPFGSGRSIRAAMVRRRPFRRRFVSKAQAGVNLTAEGGVLTFSGPDCTKTFTFDEGSGVATFGGGTVTAQSFTGLFATNGTATFGGGTATLRAVYAVSGGVATFGGGTVHRVIPVTSGVATFGGGMATFRAAYATAGGLATFGGGTATFFMPTLGLIDGSTSTGLGVDSSGTSNLVDGATALVGVD